LEGTVTTNVGTVDRILRVAIGIVLIAFALGFIAPGASYAWVGWIGVVPLLTAHVGSCPLYSVTGLSTGEEGRRAAALDRRTPSPSREGLHTVFLVAASRRARRLG
jgi:hypothetical protein